MSNLKDIETAIKIFKKFKCKFTLLHCVSTYPCKEEDLNLNMIPVLKKYKCPIGYSGHEPSVSPSIIAAILGAEVIERHITLDRSMWERSICIFVTWGLKNLTDILSKIPEILGDGKKRFLSDEKLMLKKFKYW